MNRAGNPTPEFHRALAEQHIELEPGEIDALAQHLDMLLEANERFNLTAVRDPAEAWVRHVADSLSLVPFLAETSARRVVDLGSGGGFPGVPLAIAMPDVQFTLVESVGKKARFLQAVIDRLQLRNATVRQARAEDVAEYKGGLRESFDAVVCRAVGALASLVELSLPLVKVDGWLLAIKGEKAPDEIAAAARALQELHGEVAATHRTPTGTIVAIRKNAKTSRLYPRGQGLAARKPLENRPGRED
jgi:16S rRNA (guanine527-N7)-methyltransferase